jgi:two-component sensor histidine kinase
MVEPPPRNRELRGSYALASNLSSSDIEHLEHLLESLVLLADVGRADQLVYVEGLRGPTVVYHSAPYPVPSIYPHPQVNQYLDHRGGSPVVRALHDQRGHQTVSGALIWGAPTFQEASPIYRPDGRIIGALSSNSNLLEHERFQRQDALFRMVVGRIREQVLAGALKGADKLGRLTEHDGVMIVDQRGGIRFLNSVAEHQYRRVGYVDSLLGGQIGLLDTNEYICYRSMEMGVCLEQRIEEQDQIWIKRVIPVFPTERRGKFGRRTREKNEDGYALVFVQDITEEMRREQELRIKSAMIQEVHHRVKNNLQTVATLLTMESDRTASDLARETLQQTRGRVLSIAVVHEFLSRGDASDIEILEVSKRIATEVSRVYNHDEHEIQFDIQGQPFTLTAQQATSCALAMYELIQNAAEHGLATRPDGCIRIRFYETEASKIIDIADDGVGLPAGFDLKSSPSLGLQITQTLVQGDLRGKLELLGGDGVTARISFPIELCGAVDRAEAQ